ncbi:hypothetical protein JCM11957_06200 [Caminibacter profundus]
MNGLKEILLNIIEIQKTPFYKKLEIIEKYDEIELTKKGNFKRELVKELVENGMYFGVDGYNEDNYFEIKLFKNLLLKERFYRKYKGKLVKVKKFQTLSLEEKFSVIFMKLHIRDIIDSTYDTCFGMQLVGEFVPFDNIEQIFAAAMYAVYENKKDILSKILKAVIYQFGILKDNKLILELNITKIDSEDIIDLKDINKRVADLFIDSILHVNDKEYNQKDIEIINRLLNTYYKFANMQDNYEQWYFKWLEKMGKNIDIKRLKKETEVIMGHLLQVSSEVKKIEAIAVIENFKN